MTENISNIVALIVAIIGAGTTIYNVFFKGEYGRKQKYYSSLLQPFVVAYKKNPEISAAAFAAGKATREDDNIPKYVFYLIDATQAQDNDICVQPEPQSQATNNVCETVQNQDETLRKVLIEDYISLYPNSRSKVRSFFDIALILLHYVTIVFVFVLMFVSSLLMVRSVLSLITYPFSDTLEIIKIGDLEFKAWQWSLMELLMGLLSPLMGVLLVRYTEWCNDDMYATTKKRVTKLIKKRVQTYTKNHSKYIL